MNQGSQSFYDYVEMFPSSGGGVHSHLMTCANKAAKEGISESECARILREKMPRPETPANEVESTVRKAYKEKAGTSTYKPSIMTAKEKMENREALTKIKVQRFKRLAGDGCSFQDLIASSPVDPHFKLDGYHPQMAAKLLLYLYDRHEIVWCGEQFDTEKGLDTVEAWAKRFLCLESPPPFFIPNPLSGGYAESKSGKMSCRSDANVVDYRYALFEVDLPEVTLEEQAGFWMKFKDQLPVWSITYSGGKSLHALIRVDCQNEMQWDKEIRNLAFVKWEAFGADPACKNPCRLSRLPGHMRDGKTLQQLLWVRGGGK